MNAFWRASRHRQRCHRSHGARPLLKVKWCTKTGSGANAGVPSAAPKNTPTMMPRRQNRKLLITLRYTDLHDHRSQPIDGADGECLLNRIMGTFGIRAMSYNPVRHPRQKGAPPRSRLNPSRNRSVPAPFLFRTGCVPVGYERASTKYYPSLEKCRGHNRSLHVGGGQPGRPGLQPR